MKDMRRNGRAPSRLRTGVALMAVCALVLAACGGDDGSDDADDADDAPDVEEPEADDDTEGDDPEPADDADDDAGDDDAGGGEAAGEVVYWHHFTSESEMAGLERQEEAFEERVSGVTITSETVPNPDYMPKIVTAVQGDARPDAAMVTVDRLPDMVAMGALVPLTDRIEAWELYDSYPDALWEDIRHEGELYGIPAFTFVNWLYYRVDWFEEAGLDGPPETWEELEEAAIAITDPSQGRYGIGLRGGAGGGSYITPLLESFGAQIVDDEGNPTLGDYRDEVVEALELYTGLKTEHDAVPDSVAEDSYAQLMEAFRTGQTGMVLHHTGSLAEISADLEPGVEFATAPMPVGPGGPYGRVSALYNGLMQEDNADAAWEWLIHWGDSTAQLDFLDITGYFPPSAEAQSDPRITDNEIYAAAAQAAESGRSNTKFAGKAGWESEVVLPALQSVLTGQMTVEEAADAFIEGLERQVG